MYVCPHAQNSETMHRHSLGTIGRGLSGSSTNDSKVKSRVHNKNLEISVWSEMACDGDGYGAGCHPLWYYLIQPVM